jgi:putative transposase
MEEGKGQGRRPELSGGGRIRSFGGWSQVLSLRGNREEVEQDDTRILGSRDFVSGIIREAEKNVRRYLRVGERKTFIDNSIR